MRRRDVIRRIGAATALSVGGAGVASAGDPTVTWEFADGRETELTPAAFDAHPETPDVTELRDDVTLAALCCCCTTSDNCIDCGADCPCFEP